MPRRVEVEVSKPKKRKRRSFTAEFRAEVVRLVNTGGKSIAQVAAELDLGQTAVRAWVKQAEVALTRFGGLGMTRLGRHTRRGHNGRRVEIQVSKPTKRKRRTFTAEFKAEVVRLVNKGGKSITQVAVELDP